MICKFDIRSTGDLQRILNSIDNVTRACRNSGPVKFTKQWESWTTEQREKFLDDLKDVCRFLWPLSFAQVTLEATIKDA